MHEDRESALSREGRLYATPSTLQVYLVRNGAAQRRALTTKRVNCSGRKG